jgi:hypothetical protein
MNEAVDETTEKLRERGTRGRNRRKRKRTDEGNEEDEMLLAKARNQLLLYAVTLTRFIAEAAYSGTAMITHE